MRKEIAILGAISFLIHCFVGCANKQTPSTQPTAAIKTHAAAVQTELSEVSGKDAVIAEWYRTHSR